MNLLNKDQKIDLFLTLHKELTLDDYDALMLNLLMAQKKTNQDYLFKLSDLTKETLTHILEKGEYIMPSFEYSVNIMIWMISCPHDVSLIDTEENDHHINYLENLLKTLPPYVNIPIQIIELLFDPQLLTWFQENNIKILARQTNERNRSYSRYIMWKSRLLPIFTEVDLTFKSKEYLYTTENDNT
jgi:hypothetical protein